MSKMRGPRYILESEIVNGQIDTETSTYLPRLSLVQGWVHFALNMLTGDLGDKVDITPSEVEQLRGTATIIRELDAFSTLARSALQGDKTSLDQARTYLHDRLNSDLLDISDQPNIEVSTSSERLIARHCIYPSALLNLAIGGALVAAADDDYATKIFILQQAVLKIARTSAIVMPEKERLADQSRGNYRFEGALKRLKNTDHFDNLPLDITNCVAELFDILSADDGAILQAVQAVKLEVEVEVDDNTSIIGSVDPDPVCTGTRVKLKAKAGERYNKTRGVTVRFAPYGEPGRAIEWTPEVVTVTVPPTAKSGRVYFASASRTAIPSLTERQIARFNTLIKKCRFLANGTSSSLIVTALRAPLESVRCFSPPTGVPVTVFQAPKILSFKGFLEDGRLASDLSQAHPRETVLLEWEVAADPELEINVRLYAGEDLLAEKLPLQGARSIDGAGETKVYSIRVASQCGATIRKDFTIPVRRILSFEPATVSVSPSTASLTLRVDRPWDAETTINISTSPSQPSAYDFGLPWEPGLHDIPLRYEKRGSCSPPTSCSHSDRRRSAHSFGGHRTGLDGSTLGTAGDRRQLHGWAGYGIH